MLLNAGLARLEHMYSIANAEESPIEIDAVRVDDVTQCYMALRQLDSRNTAARKFIVLDLSTNYAVQAVLKQVTAVNASCLLTSRSACYGHMDRKAPHKESSLFILFVKELYQ